MDIKDIISSGILELYATGLASAEEAAQVALWVQQYPEVAKELTEIEAGLAVYSQAHALQPGAEVKERVFAAINSGAHKQTIPLNNTPGGRTETPVRLAAFWKNAAAAAIALLLGSAALNIFLYTKNGHITNELAQSRDTIYTLSNNNREMNNYVEKVRSRFSTPVALAGLKVQDASAKVFWMKNTGEVFVDPANLPEAPKGKQYELWAIIDGKPVNAGIIVTTAKGNTYHIQQMRSFGAVQVQAFAVSVEPANVQPAETPTEVYAMGKM